jgi:hypothetical protein
MKERTKTPRHFGVRRLPDAADTIADVTHSPAERPAKPAAPPQGMNDIRCDFHPSWSADNRTLAIDGMHGGSRQRYLVAVPGGTRRRQQREATK